MSYLDLVKRPHATPKELFATLTKNFSKLPSELENRIQARVFEIFRRIVDYDSFYSFIGAESRSVEQIDELLKQAVINSKVKKYHGTLDEMNVLPTTDVQIRAFKARLP